MSRRTYAGAGVAVAIALLAIVGILAGALGTVTSRTYALGVPDQFSVATLRTGRTVCEGGVTSPAAFDAVSVWGGASGSVPAAVTVSVRAADGDAVLASGPVQAGASGAERRAALSVPVAAHRPVRVCVTGERGRFAIFGGPTVDPRVRVAGSGGQAFSLLLLSAPRSFASTLPTTFARASLFRPNWVGPWTFWLLLVGLIAAFGLAIVALMRAIGADATPEPAAEDPGIGAGPAS